MLVLSTDMQKLKRGGRRTGGACRPSRSIRLDWSSMVRRRSVSHDRRQRCTANDQLQVRRLTRQSPALVGDITAGRMFDTVAFMLVRPLHIYSRDPDWPSN